MLIANKTNKKNIISVFATLALLIGLLATAYYLKLPPFNQSTTSQINFKEPSTEEISTGNDIKEQSIDQAAGKNQTGSDSAPLPQPIEGSDKKSVHIEITTANQDETNLRVRSLIQTITSTGTCTITMTNPAYATYSASTSVQALSSSSTCKGFDIPLNQLVKGEWKITLNFKNDELTASTEKDVTIE